MVRDWIKQEEMKRYGLIGHPLKHSLSRHYFNEKFEYEGLDCLDQHFDLKTLDELHEVMAKYPDLCGFNVTIPFKEAIMDLLDDIFQLDNNYMVSQLTHKLNYE